MNVITHWRSRFLSVLLNPRTRTIRRSLVEKWRRLAGRAHVLRVFLELDDPYSYLLSVYLSEVASSYEVDLELHLTQALDAAYRPRADMLAIYAEHDCERLARELGVPFLDKGRAPPVEHRRALIDLVAERQGQQDEAEEFLTVIGQYWRGDAEGIARRLSGTVSSRRGDALLKRNQQLLRKLGHYNSAMIYYAGEWYWGVDRLHYLTQRLDELGARRRGAVSTKLASIYQAMQVRLPVAPPSAAQELPPLELFYSFRSPYSYLSLSRVFALADAFGLPLEVRPVLPMVMRGMQVPRSKRLYIIKDAAREAERMDIPFGRFADPLGRGVERCMAVFAYAQSEKRGRDFLIKAGEAIWAQGIDVATDEGMRKVTGRCGLFWPGAKAAMDDDSWRAAAEENSESMMASGAWGVPTLRLGDFVVWGQDRDWLLVRRIEELCHSGDGILI